MNEIDLSLSSIRSAKSILWESIIPSSSSYEAPLKIIGLQYIARALTLLICRV